MIVSQGVSAIAPNLLILGGTTEATALTRAVAEAGIAGTISFAGRVDRPAPQSLPRRVGGFGGVDGLKAYLMAERITHVIDATHPFAAQMSRNAVAACTDLGLPLVALTRPPWSERPGDRWQRVADIDTAVAALSGPPRRVMLAIGRMHLAAFGAQPQHHYLLRLVDAPGAPPPLPDHHAIIDRGPFTEAGDTALLNAHRIDLVVSKNSGGTGAFAKIAAARALGVPVLMVDRPVLPDRVELAMPAEVLDWIAHTDTDRGV